MPPQPETSSLGLMQAQGIARERGGLLLSGNAPNGDTPLLWQCAEGHQWTARLSNIKRGNWCATCAGNSAVTLDDMVRIAAERGGQCLSPEYLNNQTPLLWRCSEFHEWWARPRQIRRTWCPICAGNRKLELKELRKIARARGGLLVSWHYIDNRAPLVWVCEAGHVWQAAAANVKPSQFGKGSWCPHCPRRNLGQSARLSIEEMKELARSRGGECLSTSYVNCRTKLKWRCAEGHEWEAQPAQVKRRTWCPICAGTRKLTLELLSEEAGQRGGRLLSTEYAGAHSALLWECAEGHRWHAAPSAIRYGEWCPHCGGNARLTIEEMQAIAVSNGGECLSKRYVNKRTPLKWRCANGHVWRATPNMVKATGYQERGSWCPRCAHAPKHTLEDLRELAARRGGECLSRTYIDSKTPLKWRCSEGHTWEALPKDVWSCSGRTQGTWCPACALEKRKLSIEDMRAIATARGGECLSEKYVNCRTPLRWRCAAGHAWEATPGHVRPYGPKQQGSWCPVCRGRRA